MGASLFQLILCGVSNLAPQQCGVFFNLLSCVTIELRFSIPIVGGAEKVITHPDGLQNFLDLAGFAIRAGDMLLLVLPSLLTKAEYLILHDACGGDLIYQVAGHKVYPLKTYRHFKEFRKLKPIGVETEVAQLTGRPARVTYTLEQADAIIRLWHETPRRKPAEIVELVKTILDLDEDFDLKPSWVRDLVIKYVGMGQRDKPDSWSGISK